MAIVHSGPKVSGMSGLVCIKGFCLAPLYSRRVSFAQGVGIDRRSFSDLGFKLSTVVSPKLSVSMCLQGSTKAHGVDASTSVNSMEAEQEQLLDEPVNSHPTVQAVDEQEGREIHVPNGGAVQQKRCAKLHDFCLGIPFGGFVFAGGLTGFLVSRNPASLATGTLFGGSILALSVFSLKIWRERKSSLPFILGQAAIAAALLRKHFQSYSMTKQVFPSGFYIFISAAMICFYSYVLLAGGNPPPKKKLAATPSS